ncbi:hypothetical protein Tco_0496775 [Tanacetum coccineum]
MKNNLTTSRKEKTRRKRQTCCGQMHHSGGLEAEVEVAEQVGVEDLVGGVEDLVGGVEEEDEEIFREFMEEEARKEEEYARRCREEEEWEAQMDWTHPMHWTEDGNEGNREGEDIQYEDIAAFEDVAANEMVQLNEDVAAMKLLQQMNDVKGNATEDRNSVGHIAEEAKQMHVEIMEERRGVEQAECYGFGSTIPCYPVHGSVTKVQAKTKYGRLVDEKTLEVAGVGDVILKTTLGTSMTSKWNVSEGSLVVTLRKKCGSLYMVEILASTSNVPRVRKTPRSGRLRIPDEELQGTERCLTHLKVSSCDSFVKHYVKDRVRDSEMADFNKPEWYFPLEFDMKVAKASRELTLSKKSLEEFNRAWEVEDRDMTMEEYVQYETEKALRNAIVYDDPLSLKSDFSSEPTSCGHSDAFTTHILAHIRNMEDHTKQISGEFSVLIL